MERAHRAALSTFYAPGPWGESVDLGDAAAHHASVKRMAAGDAVQLSSGDGRLGRGVITSLSKRALGVSLQAVVDVGQPPSVELLAPVGDRDRMLTLAEKAVELGLSSWRPVVYDRSRSVSPRGEGAQFREKLRLRQVSALEQSGNAWLPDVHAEVEPSRAMTSVVEGTRLLLDGLGKPMGQVVRAGSSPVAIALGPEGGLTDAERDAFIAAGWTLVSLGENVLRFETAGIAALAIVRSLLR